MICGSRRRRFWKCCQFWVQEDGRVEKYLCYFNLGSNRISFWQVEVISRIVLSSILQPWTSNYWYEYFLKSQNISYRSPIYQQQLLLIFQYIAYKLLRLSRHIILFLRYGPKNGQCLLSTYPSYYFFFELKHNSLMSRIYSQCLVREPGWAQSRTKAGLNSSIISGIHWGKRIIVQAMQVR